MGKTLVIDFETDDKYIKEGKGAGWVWGIPVLGLAVRELGMKEPVAFLTTTDEILAKIAEADTLIAHNAQYEAGVLLMLGVDIKNYRFIDTMILAKLYDNSLFSYGLGDLGSKYLGRSKDDAELGEVAKRIGLVKSISQNAVLKAKENMGAVYEHAPETVAKYAKVDVEIAEGLYELFRGEEANFPDREFYSDLIKSFVLSRKRGVRASVAVAESIYHNMKPKEEEYTRCVYDVLGKVNISSQPQLKSAFTKAGAQLPIGRDNKVSFSTETLAGSEIGRNIINARKYKKFINDFILPIIENKEQKDGFVTIHPEIKILEAVTGRSSSRNPNIQQIPKRSKEDIPIRSMYVPFPGEKWFSLDFSAQEPRLHAHYAKSFCLEGVDKVISEYNSNPAYNIHTQVSKELGIDRSLAKEVNLGIAYGASVFRLSKSLNLPLQEASAVYNKVSNLLPYLSKLSSICSLAMSKRGFIKTLGGLKIRHVRAPSKDKPNKIFDNSKDALNYATQGSAAHQTNAAIVRAYREGVQILFPVHDEVCMSADLPTALKMKKYMEECMPMLVPSLVEISVGDSWGEAVALTEKGTISPIGSGEKEEDVCPTEQISFYGIS